VNSAWLQRSDDFLRGLTPAGTTLLMVFASAIPWHVPGLSPITPAMSFMAIYYWSIYRPDKLPYAATFCLGLFQDLIVGTPLGMTALVLLLIQGTVASQRRFFHGKPFFVVWWGFSFVMPASAGFSWVISSIYLGGVVPPLPLITQTIFTVLLYPVFATLFSQVQSLILQRT